MEFHIDDTTKAVRCCEEISRSAKRHALLQYPQESVGCVADDEYVPLINVSPSPTKNFVVREYPDNMQALIHSHPDILPAPSAADMRQQQAMQIPWGIVSVDGRTNQASDVEWFGDQTPIPPLVGRTFLSGVRDCWCLVRDWYRINCPSIGNTLPQLPRDPDWFKNGKDLLTRQNVLDAGFVFLHGRNDLRVGDMVMGKIASRVVNHCGILLPDGLVLTHSEGRLSHKEVVRQWIQSADYVIRHQEFLNENTPLARSSG